MTAAPMQWRKPRWRSTLPFLLLIVLFLIAANWQWRRAEFKEARAAEFAAALRSAATRSLSAALAAPQATAERVHIEGALDRERIILLDNRIVAGQYGVDVYAVLRISTGPAILVGLGWIPADRSRRTAPLVPPLPSMIDGAALLIGPPAPGLRLGADLQTNDAPFPILLSRIDIAALRKRLGQPDLPDRIALLAPDAQSGFVRDWRLPGLGAERHRGYALQWLSFAVGTLVFFILWHRPRKDSVR